ncbi:MAG: hypothetical protein AAGI34_02970 [Pseudomonadota bacterium]
MIRLLAFLVLGLGVAFIGLGLTRTDMATQIVTKVAATLDPCAQSPDDTVAGCLDETTAEAAPPATILPGAKAAPRPAREATPPASDPVIAAATEAAAKAAAEDTKRPRVRTPAHTVQNPCGFGNDDRACQVKDGVYRALVPPRYGPHPTVVYLYGSTGISTTYTASAFFRRKIVERGYALIVPAALDVDYIGGIRGTGWGLRSRTRHPRDDIAFLKRVLLDAERRFNIDPRNVLFMGQSDGGFFIYEIACHNPEMGAAFAVHGASYGSALPRTCKTPVRFLHTHGKRDAVVPFSGERLTRGRVSAVDTMAALGLIAKTNGCVGEARKGSDYQGFERLTFQRCRLGSSAEYLIHEGGHGYPANWIGAVLDWYENPQRRPSGATVRRRASESGTVGGRFQSVPQ